MRSTSALYKQLRNEGADLEARLIIAGSVYYSAEGIVSLRTTPRFLGNGPSAGSVIVSEIDTSIILNGASIPRGAKMEVAVRYTDGTRSSEWLAKGTFYIDTRRYDKESDVLTIHGYDVLAKTEQRFTRAGEQGRWPMTDIAVVDEICAQLSVTLDSRTRAIMTSGYEVAYPGYGNNAYYIRSMLSYIAGMYAGNWIMTEENKLRLIALGDIPAETNLLIEEHGDIILIGGVGILV